MAKAEPPLPEVAADPSPKLHPLQVVCRKDPLRIEVGIEHSSFFWCLPVICASFSRFLVDIFWVTCFHLGLVFGLCHLAIAVLLFSLSRRFAFKWAPQTVVLTHEELIISWGWGWLTLQTLRFPRERVKGLHLRIGGGEDSNGEEESLEQVLGSWSACFVDQDDVSLSVSFAHQLGKEGQRQVLAILCSELGLFQGKDEHVAEQSARFYWTLL